MTEFVEKPVVESWIILDGVCLPASEAKLPCDDPGVLLGCTVFDSFVSFDNRVSGLSMHLSRLASSAKAVRIPCADEEVLRQELSLVLSKVEGDIRVRITLTGGGHRMVSAIPFERARIHQPVVAASCSYPGYQWLPGWIKHGSRFGSVWEKERTGADVLLFKDADGRYLEACTAGIIVERDGVLYSTPHEGEILSSVTVTHLHRRALKLGLKWSWSAPESGAQWDAIYVASSGRDLAPVESLDGEKLVGWGANGRKLAESWSPLDGELISR